MINIKAALAMTKTMICSIVDYSNIFLSVCNKNDLEDLQILQNQALRCCFNNVDPRDEHIDVLHQMANIIVQEQGLRNFEFGDTQYAQGLTSDYYRGDPGDCP